MALQTGRSQHSYSFDADTLMSDGGTAHTTSEQAEVSSAAAFLDFGNTTSGPSVEQVAYTKGDLVIDVTAFDFTTGDETAQVILQLSDRSDFDESMGVVVNKCVALAMGDDGGVAAGAGADDDSATGRNVVGVDNEHKGTVYRYARLFVVVAGTTPSITFSAFWAERK